MFVVVKKSDSLKGIFKKSLSTHCKKSYSFSNVLFDLVLSIYYDFVLKLRYSESNISHTFASTLPAIIWRNLKGLILYQGLFSDIILPLALYLMIVW